MNTGEVPASLTMAVSDTGSTHARVDVVAWATLFLIVVTLALVVAVAYEVYNPIVAPAATVGSAELAEAKAKANKLQSDLDSARRTIANFDKFKKLAPK